RFMFQAEDGIRDRNVTGVQTCALPISYRLLTSRAEHRLLLRHDNADMRLTEIGYQNNLISEERYARFNEKKSNIEAELERLKKVRIKPNAHTQNIVEQRGGTALKDGILAADLLRRPEMDYA